MSIEIKYNRLFEILLTHEFYENGIAEGIHIKPTAKTKKLMQEARLRYKQIGNALICSFLADNSGSTPLIELIGDHSFDFMLLSDPVKLNSRTQMDTATTDYFSGALMLFENVPADASQTKSTPEQLEHSLLDGAMPARFTIEFKPAGPLPSLDLLVIDEAGNSIPSGKDALGADLPVPLITDPDSQGRYRGSVDLSKRASGMYTIQFLNGATVEFTKRFYVGDRVYAVENVIGILRLKYDQLTNHLYGGTDYYNLVFKRKNALWKYIVVNKNLSIDMVGNTLEVNDTSGASTPYPAVVFNALGAVPNPDESFNGYDTAVFTSDQQLPFFENPKTGIELVEINGGSSKVVIPDLPNPSIRHALKKDGTDPVSEVYVFV